MVNWHGLSLRAGLGNISVLELHLSGHADYRLLCDNHHQLQTLLGRPRAAGLPADPPALLCSLGLTHMRSSTAAGLHFLATNALLGSLLWCHIRKGLWVLETTFIGAEGGLRILFQPRTEVPC